MCKIQFRNEDCLKTIETIKKANKKIDLVLTSPPYNGSRNNKKKNEKYSTRKPNNHIPLQCEMQHVQHLETPNSSG